jgi:hypothetical protein
MLRLKGKGKQSIYSDYKAKYSYQDARGRANQRGSWIRGPLRILLRAASINFQHQSKANVSLTLIVNAKSA